MKRILSGAAGLALLVFTIGFVASAARADTFTQPVGDAGSVTFSTDGGVLAFVSAEAAAGWTYTIDRQDDGHLQVTFRDATGAEVEFEAEFEDGALDLEGSDEPTTTVGDTTGDTIADDDQDDEFDDESDDDSDDESDDNSGPGSGDDEDESDDNSGPGSGDDEDEDDDSDDESDDDEDEDEDDDDDEFSTTTTTVVTIP
jgi:hypothetical protein